jgi:uncharacterized protein HemX
MGSIQTMTGVLIAVAVAVVLTAVGLLVVRKHRVDHQRSVRRSEAADARDRARTTDLKAQQHAAQADERAARARREQAEAEQQRVAAEQSRSTAQDLRSHADDIDPDANGNH